MSKHCLTVESPNCKIVNIPYANIRKYSVTVSGVHIEYMDGREEVLKLYTIVKGKS